MLHKLTQVQDLPSIITSPISNWQERKGKMERRGRRRFSNFKNEHVNLL